MTLKDFEEALGPIKCSKITIAQNYVLKLNNDSTLTVAYVNGEYKSYVVDGKNSQETKDLIENHIKKLKKLKKL